MTEDGLSSQQTLTIPSPKSTSSLRSGGIMRHVSNILSGNKKQSTKHSFSPTSSVLKLPKSMTNLGRSNSKSSLISTSYSASVTDVKVPPTDSQPSISSPLNPTFKTHTTLRSVAHSTGSAAVQRIMTIVAVVGPFPQEVVDMIVSYAPRRSLPTLARTCRAFCKAARLALYTTIDVRFIRSARFEQLCTLLAANIQLAGLIQTFTYHTWHPSFFQRTGKSLSRARDTRISLLASATATLANALKNMQNLQSLTLPSFNASLMQDASSPMLKKVTFFNHSLSPEEQHELKLWLFTQPGLLSLSFPNLFEKSSPSALLPPPSLTPSAPGTPEMTPPATPQLSHSRSPVISSPSTPRLGSLSPIAPSFTSAISERSHAFLPILQYLNAPPSLATSILSSQTSSSSLPTPPPSSHSASVDISRNGSAAMTAASPLKCTTLRVHSTLYTGLRPSTLMQSLSSRGTTALVLRFSDDMDRRTVEKMLGAAGSVLGQITPKKRRLAALETLEVEVGNAGIWTDDDVRHLSAPHDDRS
ncbi:hypothetical protein ONZ45_g8114 [Pleurotus djamor]|nr:hypothetical protein ONZ45_g8114 [Pleurotus djamor]